YRVRVAVRRPDLAGHLQPLGSVGQIHAVQANLRYPDSVDRAVDGAWAVVNCVGVLCEKGKQRFDAVHSAGVKAIASAARGAGVARFVHLSAIGANAESKSAYGHSKAAGEALAQEEFPESVILRPSVIFGPGDDFMNRFASLARFMPVLPVVAPDTRFQPVFVGDVADASVNALDSGSGIYELGGPDVRTMTELMEHMLRVIERPRVLVPVPFAVARFMAVFTQLMPNPLLTVDQLMMLGYDNVVSDRMADAGQTLEGLGVNPTAMDVILPTYLERFRRSGQFRTAAGRSG
ncbi:MAG: complex I NDUFA9 subunit family protein, partial [Fimbriimonadaceae bacterium]|nr:complex I NDUFA9 subunit family protein [Alphaproteobacteria bacterium]